MVTAPQLGLGLGTTFSFLALQWVLVGEVSQEPVFSGASGLLLLVVSGPWLMAHPPVAM